MVKQRHLEEVCKGELDIETVDRVLQWGADLVKYYRALEPGIRFTIPDQICQVHPGRCIQVQFFGRCISTAGQAALLFGKGSYSPVEAARRAPGEYVETNLPHFYHVDYQKGLKTQLFRWMVGGRYLLFK